MLKDQMHQLAQSQEGPCVTIALATHRTHPDNQQDAILLKNLVNEAENRLLKDYDRRSVDALLKNLHSLETRIDNRLNDFGLYVFASAGTAEYVRTMWPPAENKVYVDKEFALRDIIKAYNRSEDYYILHLSQSGVQLYEALNDRIYDEVAGNGFPYRDNPHYITDRQARSDPKKVDNQIKEFLNKVDKSMVAVHAVHPLEIIVAATRENFDYLLEVADQPKIYSGHFTIDAGRADIHYLSDKAWPVVKDLQKARRAAAIDELMAGVSSGKVLTDMQEIYLAAREGRGELLLVKSNFSQPIDITPQGFDYAKDATVPGINDDIVNDIAWEVVDKKGRVFFTDQPALRQLGDIALLTRY
ncbi:hypothetical protein [Chitinophaga caseinilytica]|uniref:baeRF3 domain-containing protein n=1 Tax=Chitinophaga caseinilytica TaxID=2267521 RepID=UPI003C2BB1AE